MIPLITNTLRIYRHNRMFLIRSVSMVWILFLAIPIASLSPVDQPMIIVSLALTILELRCLYVAIMVSSQRYRQEQQKQTLTLVLSHYPYPARYVIARRCGQALITIGIWAMGVTVVSFFVAWYDSSWVGGVSLLAIVFAILCKVLIIQALVMMISYHAGLFVSVASGVVVYVTGHLTWFLVDTVATDSHASWWSWISIQWLYYLIPNMWSLSLADMLHTPVYVLSSHVMIWLIVMSAAWIVLFLLITILTRKR